MLFVLLPQESLFRDAEHSVHSVLLVEMNCSLQFNKEFSTLDNNFVTEAVPEKYADSPYVGS